MELQPLRNQQHRLLNWLASTRFIALGKIQAQKVSVAADAAVVFQEAAGTDLNFPVVVVVAVETGVVLAAAVAEVGPGKEAHWMSPNSH